MRLMTWNVNGIKTLTQYSPWNALKTYEAILNELGADIVCFQETKITKKQVERSMAIIPSYDSFFSSYSRKPEKGYSGTCIFTKKSTTVPCKAEEGLTGLLPRCNGAETEQPIEGYLSEDDVDLNEADMMQIDMEGRTTIVDLGLFVCINLYCPNETNEERLDFKLAFNALVEARVLNLVKAGREVVVLGDLNIAANPLDHCDPVKRSKDSPHGGYEDHPARKWLNEFVGENGSMIDLGRHFHPGVKGMFTHWETRINARETNYGSRIDYILATPGLLPWIKTCGIQPHIYGSDHCPVIADFHDSIQDKDGTTLYLSDAINPPGRLRAADGNLAPWDPPKLAARYYPAFGNEQRLLSTFFGKKSDTPKPSAPGRASSPTNHDTTPSGVQANSQRPFLEIDSVSGDTRDAAKARVARMSTSKKNNNPSPVKVATQTIDLTGGDAQTKQAAHTSSKRSAQSMLPLGTATIAKAKESQGSLKQYLLKHSSPSKQTSPDGQRNKRRSYDSDSTHDSLEPLGPQRQPAAASRKKKRNIADTSTEVTKDKADDQAPPGRTRGPTSGQIETTTETVDLSSDDSPPLNDLDDALGGAGRDRSSSTMLQGSTPESSAAWSSIFSSRAAPLCTGHGEPCKQWTVNKSGKNKGRMFWLCNRPVGEGYDDGQRKTAINPEFRCNYFKWESDVKRSRPDR